MTKKHFINLADKISEHNRAVVASGRGTLFTSDQLATLAEFCKSQNYAFMEDRWMDYISGECGPSGGAIKKAS